MEFLTDYYKSGGNADELSPLTHLGIITESGNTHQVSVGGNYSSYKNSDAQDYMRKVGGSSDLNTYQNTLMDIFRKSASYREQIENLENKGQSQSGGKLNDTVRLMLDISKKIKASGKYKEIPPKHLLKIAKLIVDDSKNKTGSSTITEEVKTLSLKEAENPEKYVDQYKKQQADTPSSNSRSKKTSKTSNSRKNTNYEWDLNRRGGFY